MLKISWRAEEDEITFRAIEKYRYGLRNTHTQLALEKPVEEIDFDIWMYYVSLQLS